MAALWYHKFLQQNSYSAVLDTLVCIYRYVAWHYFVMMYEA